MDRLQKRIKELKELTSDYLIEKANYDDTTPTGHAMNQTELKGIEFAQQEILKIIDEECFNLKICKFCPELKKKIKGESK